MPRRQIEGRVHACADVGGRQWRTAHHRRDVHPQDPRGHLTSYELAELDEHESVPYDVVDEARGLLSVVDIANVGELVSLDSSAVLMVIEHAWTSHLEQAVRAANGRIVFRERIPHDVGIAALEASGWPPKGRHGTGATCSGDG